MSNQPTNGRRKASEEDVPITTRWCHRALRPLIIALLAVEKELKESMAHSQPHKNEEHRPQEEASTTQAVAAYGSVMQDGSSDVEEAERDPEWVPTKSLQKRSSNRHMPRRSRNCRAVPSGPDNRRRLPGELDIAVSPALRHEDARPQTQPTSLGQDHDIIGRTPIKFKRYKAVSCVSSRNFEYTKGMRLLQSNFLRVLSMTAPKDQPRETGAKSLFSVATKAISSWILDEQKAADEEDEDVDVADSIFTGLEATYGSSNGWKPLKQLVRAHAIRLVCEAIQQNWLTPKNIRAIATFVEIAHHQDAFEAMMVTYQASTTSDLGKPQISPFLKRARLRNRSHLYRNFPVCSCVRQNPSFAWREIGKLFETGKFDPIWTPILPYEEVTACLQSVLHPNEHSQASAHFVTKCITASLRPYSTVQWPVDETPSKAKKRRTRRSSCKKPSQDEHAEALNKRIAIMLKILSVSQSADCTKLRVYMPDHTLAYVVWTELLCRCRQLVESKQQHTQGQQLRMVFVFVSYYISVADELDRNSCLKIFERFMQTMREHDNLVKGLADYVINICCGPWQNVEVRYPQVQEVVKLLSRVDGSFYPTVKAFLDKAAVSSALEYASLTLLPEHHEFAISFQARVETKGKPYAIELPPSLAWRGYEWDNDLDEWVARPPALNRRYRKGSLGLTVSSSQGDRSEFLSDSPTVFSGSPDRCSSGMTTPSPGRKRRAEAFSDGYGLQRVPAKRSRCVLRKGSVSANNASSNEDVDASDSSDSATYSHGFTSRRRAVFTRQSRQPSMDSRLVPSIGGQRQLRPRHKRLSYTIPIHEDESDSSVGSSSTSYHARSSTWRPNVVTRRALKERHSLENFAGTARRQSSEKLSQIAVVIDNSRYHVAGQHGSENILTTPSKAGCSSGLLNADKRETLELRYTENGSPLVQETDQESNSDEEDVDDDVLSRPFVPRRQSLRKRMPVVTPIGSAASGTESTYALRCRGRTRHSSSESRRSSIAIPPTPGNNSSDDELSYL